MKKNAFAAACLAVSLALLSCHDVIFYEIRQEVKLNKGQISGDVNSIVEFAGKLYVQNGNIYCKDKNLSAYGQWSPVSRSGMGSGKVIKLAAGDKLYALVARIEADKDEGENYVAGQTLYYTTDGNTWQQVTDSGSTPLSLSATGNFLFSLDSTSGTNGEETAVADNNDSGSSMTAYLQSGSTIYKLENGKADTTGGIAYKIKAGDYEASGSTITGSDSFSYNVGSTIHSMAKTSDCLVVGTDSGLRYINTSTKEEISVANSASALSSYYEVHCVLVADPSKTAKEADIYATAIFSGTSSSTGASSDNEGLWAYYPTRGNWNRE